MNLLDQLELYTIKNANGKVSQREYWEFVYESMKSGMLMTRNLEKHLRHKLENLSAQLD